MRHLQLTLGVLFAMTLVGGCRKAPEQKSTITLPPAGANNRFYIDFQEGFFGNDEIVVEIDGHEVYRGYPETDQRIGLAEHFVTASASTQPVLAVTIPGKKIHWSKQIDLSQGAVGISLTNSGLHVQQSVGGFGYE
jgi:hypothetical protein